MTASLAMTEEGKITLLPTVARNDKKKRVTRITENEVGLLCRFAPRNDVRDLEKNLK